MDFSIQLTDQDARELDALNGAEILELRRYKHVYDRVIQGHRAELVALRAENGTLRMELDALKQALSIKTTMTADVTPLVPDAPEATIAAISKMRDSKRNGAAAHAESAVGGDG